MTVTNLDALTVEYKEVNGGWLATIRRKYRRGMTRYEGFKTLNTLKMIVREKYPDAEELN